MWGGRQCRDEVHLKRRLLPGETVPGRDFSLPSPQSADVLLLPVEDVLPGLAGVREIRDLHFEGIVKLRMEFGHPQVGHGGKTVYF